MTHFDLFSGIGGFALAAQWAGIETVGFSEIDPFCCQLLAKRFPGVQNYGDIRNIKGESIGYVDLITGGFPCQDISSAWAGGGINGKRSSLWFEMHRLIREIEPKHVIIENVANLRKRGLADVIWSLAKIGYSSSWEVFKASDFGAPHERARIIIYAFREWERVKFASDCFECDCCGEPFCESCQQHYSECPCPGPHSEDDGWKLENENWGFVAYPDLSGRKEQRRASAISPEHVATECVDWWKAKPGICGVADGVSRRVDRLRALGNAVVPQVVYPIMKAIKELYEHE